MLRLYRTFVQMAAPFLPAYLKHRLVKGKEDAVRLEERFGHASAPRPQGKLIWFHAASVGESLSLFKLLETLRRSHPHLGILVTTGTVTSAKLMAERLPEGVIHQYVPLDVPRWLKNFLDHWQPNLVVTLESEIWPNMILLVKKRQIPLVMLNARLSDRSYRRWKLFPRTVRTLLGQFDLFLTPSEVTADRLKQLGAGRVEISTNLKFTCDPPTFDSDEAKQMKETIGIRKVWAAASTHDGEEPICLDAHISLKDMFPDLLMILAPRHPDRTSEVLSLIEQRGLKVARRSLGESPTVGVDVWLVDTMGDMGLVYELVDVAFLGGSLVPVGGHNPVEAVQLGTVVLHGPYEHNARDIHNILEPALVKLTGPEDLSLQVLGLLKHPERVEVLKEKGHQILSEQNAGVDDILDHLLHLLN